MYVILYTFCFITNKGVPKGKIAGLDFCSFHIPGKELRFFKMEIEFNKHIK